MDFLYGSSFGMEPPEAYERLLLDCMLGDATLFTRIDETELAWQLVDTIVQGVARDARAAGAVRAGHMGAEEADALDRARWQDLEAIMTGTHIRQALLHRRNAASWHDGQTGDSRSRHS